VTSSGIFIWNMTMCSTPPSPSTMVLVARLKPLSIWARPFLPNGNRP
jgi:hypothetical protein